MTQREPSAPQALYGHLPSADREPVQRQQPRLADAMFPSLAPTPQPKPPVDRWREAAANARAGWAEANARAWGRR
jgi:hypothetical protein